VPWRYGLRPTSLRQEAGRPQLKRGPLGRSSITNLEVSAHVHLRATPNASCCGNAATLHSSRPSQPSLRSGRPWHDGAPGARSRIDSLLFHAFVPPTAYIPTKGWSRWRCINAGTRPSERFGKSRGRRSACTAHSTACPRHSSSGTGGCRGPRGSNATLPALYGLVVTTFLQAVAESGPIGSSTFRPMGSSPRRSRIVATFDAAA